MRTSTLAGLTLLIAATLAPAVGAATTGPPCDPHPLNQGHPGWMKMPSGAVDRRASAPYSATNPMMQATGRLLPVSGPLAPSGAPQLNPLTHRP